MEKHKFQIKCRSSIRTFGIILLTLCICIQAYAQNRIVSGKVLDPAGEPVIGANVKVSGTTRGTITDMDGNFQLEAAPNEKLTVTYIGFNDAEVLASSTTINVVLNEDNLLLDEVVVVGYGTQKKATLTGAVSYIKSEELTITKNENVINMLTGKVPGVRISQKSSRPGGFETDIDIRGMGEPLIVVDGVPRDKDYFSRMDANEIESISVLKDGSAAIYGLRSANGVILVTTKRGVNKSGVEITFSTNFGWQQFLHTPDNVDALQYMTLVNERNWQNFNNNFLSRMPPSYSDQEMEPYRNGTLQTTDWQDAVFRKSAPQQQHNLTVNGGTEKISYFFNLGYMKQESSLRSNSMDYDRWNFRSNIDAQITKRLKAQVSLGGYADEMNEPRTDIWAIYKAVWIQRPTSQVYANNNTEYLNNREVTDGNPVAITDSDYTGYRKTLGKVFNGQIALMYDIPGVEGLTARAMYSYDFKYQDKTDYQKAYYLYNYHSETNFYEAVPKNNPSAVRRESFPDHGTLMQLQLNYNRTFGGAHNVSALALFEEQYTSWDSFYAYRQIYVNSEYLFAGEDKNQQGNMYGIGERVSKAFVGKFNYDYKGKYLAEFSFRYDGSSRFPKESRWGFFPSASVGWRISEESFIQNNIPFMDNLKVRATYGKMGDDRAAGTYPPNIVGYNLDGDNLGWIYGGDLIGGVNPTAIPNPDLTWYTAEAINFGVDVDLWNGLLGGTVEYFRRNRNGLLERRKALIPNTVGAELPQENIESDRTFGYEIVLTHRNKIRDFSYYVNAQLSATKNKWRDKVAERAGNSYDNWKNREQDRYKDIWWGKAYGGQFTNYQDIYYHPTAIGAGDKVPGDYWYQDWNGDGIINDKDEHPIATYGMPIFNYGISLGGAWRGIDLSLHFQGAAKVYVQYNEAVAEPLPFDQGGTLSKFWDRWHPVDPNADIFDPTTEWVSGYYPITGSSRAEGSKAVENASYLRLKTLELGYTLPNKWLKGVGVKDLRIYFSGYNLLTFTGLKHMDPEHPGGTEGNDNKSGNTINNYKYPINRSYNIGASIKF